MSAIYFHSQQQDNATGLRTEGVTVRGPERALFGAYCNADMLSALSLSDRTWIDKDWAAAITQLLRESDGRPLGNCPAAHLATYLSVEWRSYFDLGALGQIGIFSVALNTLLASGSDPMILAARIHGQCEMHCYVEGENRAWLAGIVERARAAGIYRADMGWESVVELLRESDAEPVVLSYSVTAGFPNFEVARDGGTWTPPEAVIDPSLDDDEADEAADEAWYELPVAQQWGFAFAAIRQSPHELELRPDKWKWPEYWFEGDVTAFNIAEIVAGKLKGDYR